MRVWTVLCAVAFTAACGGGSNPSAPTEPVVATPAPVETILVGAGDIGWKGSDIQRYTGRIVADAVALEAAIPFTIGDNAYPKGSYADFMTNYHDFWGSFREKTLAVAGNHEYETPNAEGHFAYYGDAADPDRTKTGWYAKRFPTVFVVVLNSNVDMGDRSPQLKWLRAVLATNASPCTMAIWHHPRWSSGKNGDHPGTDKLWRALYDAGADVIVNAHEHAGERMAPQNPDGVRDIPRGIRQFTAGGGGAPLYDLKTRKPHSEMYRKEHSVLKLVFRERSYRWQFIAIDRSVIDSDLAVSDAEKQCH